MARSEPSAEQAWRASNPKAGPGENCACQRLPNRAGDSLGGFRVHELGPTACAYLTQQYGGHGGFKLSCFIVAVSAVAISSLLGSAPAAVT